MADALDDRREVAEAPAGGARTALEQRVGAEHHAGVVVLEAHPAGRVAGRVPHLEVVAAGVQHRGRRRGRRPSGGRGRPGAHSSASAGCSRIGAPVASARSAPALMWSLWPWVATIATTRGRRRRRGSARGRGRRRSRAPRRRRRPARRCCRRRSPRRRSRRSPTSRPARSRCALRGLQQVLGHGGSAEAVEVEAGGDAAHHPLDVGVHHGRRSPPALKNSIGSATCCADGQASSTIPSTSGASRRERPHHLVAHVAGAGLELARHRRLHLVPVVQPRRLVERRGPVDQGDGEDAGRPLAVGPDRGRACARGAVVVDERLDDEVGLARQSRAAATASTRSRLGAGSCRPRPTPGPRAPPRPPGPGAGERRLGRGGVVLVDGEARATDGSPASAPQPVDARRPARRVSPHSNHTTFSTRLAAPTTGAEDLAALHLVERLLDVVEGDRLGHEPLERQAALQVEVDEHREVAATAGSRRTSSA